MLWTNDLMLLNLWYPPENLKWNIILCTETDFPTINPIIFLVRSISHLFTTRIISENLPLCCKWALTSWNSFFCGHPGFPPLDSWLRCFYVTLILHPSAPFWQHLFQVCGFQECFLNHGVRFSPFLGEWHPNVLCWALSWNGFYSVLSPVMGKCGEPAMLKCFLLKSGQ